MKICPLFVILTPTDQDAVIGQIQQQVQVINKAFAPAGISFDEEMPVVFLPVEGQINLTRDRERLQAALSDAVLAATGGVVPGREVVPIYVGNLEPITKEDGTRSALHGYSDYWLPENPWAGIYLDANRLPGNAVPHTETGTTQATTGSTLVHEFGHLLADLEHTFTPGQTCVLDPDLRGQMNNMDYDADMCRGQWTPEQLATIATRTRERLAFGRSGTRAQEDAQAAPVPQAAPLNPLKNKALAENILSVLAVAAVFGVCYWLVSKMLS